METENNTPAVETVTRDAILDGLRRFIDMTEADEVMLATQIHDHGARLRSYAIGAEVCSRLIAAGLATASASGG